MSTDTSSPYDLVIIGAGLSGLAAGLRMARFGQRVIILEKHVIPGGLNSYYTRKNILFETGLHAITNYAAPKDRRAPLNRLLRQLKISREELVTHEQVRSEILFDGQASLSFSNDFQELCDQVATAFPHAIDAFTNLVSIIDAYDAFAPVARISTREKLAELLPEPLLVEMLLCPVMFYGGSEEHDIDFSQFVIMFRALFQEGFFRCAGGVKWLLDLLVERFKEAGGEIRFRAPVTEFITQSNTVTGVKIKHGDIYKTKHVLSTMGYPNTLKLIDNEQENTT